LGVVAVFMFVLLSIPISLSLTLPMRKLGHKMQNHISKLDFQDDEGVSFSYLSEVRHLEASFYGMTAGKKTKNKQT